MPRPTPKTTPPAQTVTVHPFWLLKALALVLLAALFCTYLALCLLFYRGQWQLVLHPVQNSAGPLAASDVVRFGPDESATPQLVGRWLPAAAGARYASTTILFLPGGDGSLADFNPTIEALRGLGLNVFAFDYRGYGLSAKTQPSEQKMTQDAESAWQYLTGTRGIPASRVVPYGTGVGASLATTLVLRHPESPALILESPKCDLAAVVGQDPRTTLIPVRLLFHENFPLAEPLSGLKTPKLLISSPARPSEALQAASDPKITVKLQSVPGTQYEQVVVRFLDQYLSESG